MCILIHPQAVLSNSIKSNVVAPDNIILNALSVANLR